MAVVKALDKTQFRVIASLGGEEGFLATLNQIARENAGGGSRFISNLFMAFAAAHQV